MTPFENIYPYALQLIDDYRLDKLATTSVEQFKLYLQRNLINAIPRFYGCQQSLEYDLTSASFINDLTLAEQAILGDLMVLVWYRKVVNDITQQNEGLQGRDKKQQNKATNLKAKQQTLNAMEEQVRNRISFYQLNDNFDKIFGLN